MMWRVSNRASRYGRLIADRHYNRQSIGHPQFVPPGSCLVLTANQCLWVSSWPMAEFVKHRWAGAWMCTIFRKERSGVASEFIRQAIAATRYKWPNVPELGMVTFIDPEKVRPIKRRGQLLWGYSWVKAGFKYVGTTEGGLLAFQILPDDMPEAAPAVGMQQPLFS